MRFGPKRFAVAAAVAICLAGCRSSSGPSSIASWNPFHRSSEAPPYPEKPSQFAQPTGADGASDQYAVSGPGSTAPAYSGASGPAQNNPYPVAQTAAEMGAGPAADNPYAMPQAGQYSAGGYTPASATTTATAGSMAGGPSGPASDPYAALNRSSSDPYARAPSYGPYGDAAGMTPPAGGRYGADSQPAAPGAGYNSPYELASMPARGSDQPAGNPLDGGRYADAAGSGFDQGTGYNPGNTGYTPGQTEYQPGQTEYDPGQTGYPGPASPYTPGATNYQPGATNYQPGATDYPPGQTGYQPPGVQPYASPATAYQPPDGGYTPPADPNVPYTPGSIQQPTEFSTTPATTASGYGTAPQPTDPSAAPTGYAPNYDYRRM